MKRTFIIIIVLSLANLIFFEFYSRVYQSNVIVSKSIGEQFIVIPTDAVFSDVLELFSNHGLLKDISSFEWLSIKKKYVDNIKPGKYKIKNGLNNNQLINLLRSGEQYPVKLTFNNLRTKEDLAGLVSKYIEADSSSIIDYITKSDFLQKLQLNQHNVACLFIPNTYEFYWNTSAEEFVNRMIREYSNFWNGSRKKKADLLNLNYYEISVLASIVEKEQNIKVNERPMIAGLYLNRIRKGMKLESDPTLIFAIGDFSINRVLNKDKKITSPFNTYINKGLPPGPICIPSINAIDAVLNATNHEYIFMCAKDDFSGYHNFAKTYTRHLINARKYQKALNKRRIMR